MASFSELGFVIVYSSRMKSATELADSVSLFKRNDFCCAFRWVDSVIVDLLKRIWVSVHTRKARIEVTVLGKALYIFEAIFSVDEVKSILLHVLARLRRTASVMNGI
jgi:transcriptional regulator of nitric oxide reductase